MQREHIEHTIEPVFDERSEVLVLGTMPSPKSREIGFYYGHPQNRFWRVIAALFDEPVPENNADRIDLLLRHHIALWDVLASCDIEGASDASISNAVPNDLSRITSVAPIQKVFCTGATSAKLYGKLCEPQTGILATKLPSTSPANAAWSLKKLIGAYRVVADSVSVFTPPVLDVPKVVELEQTIAAAGTPLSVLMRRAGRFLAYELKKQLDGPESKQDKNENSKACSPEASAKDPSHPVVIFCGNGNNGGDGWVAGEYLDSWGIPVHIITAKSAEELSAEPARSAALEATAKLSSKSKIFIAPETTELEQLTSESSLLIDAILGTGFSHDSVRPPFNRWIKIINAQAEEGTPVVAADVPSGLSAQTGTAALDTTNASLTVTMIVPKPGLFVGEGKDLCGKVVLAPIAYIEPLVFLAQG